MISIPGSLSFAKLVMMSSAPAKSAGDARDASQIPSFNQRCPIQSRLQPVLVVHSFYVERNELTKLTETLKIGQADLYCSIICFFSCGSRPSGKLGLALKHLICFSW